MSPPCQGLTILLRPVIGTVQRWVHMTPVTCSLTLERIHIGRLMTLTGLGLTPLLTVPRAHVHRASLAALYRQMTDIILPLECPRLRRAIARILRGRDILEICHSVSLRRKCGGAHRRMIYLLLARSIHQIPGVLLTPYRAGTYRRMVRALGGKGRPRRPERKTSRLSRDFDPFLLTDYQVLLHLEGRPHLR